jgi:lipopolysaccharide/colanic/teichoic acid biosynthesis glycosyltransferase
MSETNSMRKHLLYLGTPNDQMLLKETFPDSVISSFFAFEGAKQVTLIQPDAVVLIAHEINEAFLSQLQSLRAKLESAAIPLLVMGDNLTNETKKLLLDNGADDWFNSNPNLEGLDRWIDFLKLSKKAEKEKEMKEVMEKIQKTDSRIPWGKRLFDIAASSFALLVLSPIMIIIAILVKLESKGPIIYSSKRAGSGYKVFDFLKFRSMYVGADAELIKLKHLNQYNGDQNSVFFKIKDDPRITRLGNFLRNTSLDELPQLINVLKGDMSIVGNRPLPLYEAQMLTKDHAAMRFLAPAGITGLWQVTKRGKKDLSEEERIALDVEYANNHTLKNDFMIVIKTIPALTQEVAV